MRERVTNAVIMVHFLPHNTFCRAPNKLFPLKGPTLTFVSIGWGLAEEMICSVLSTIHINMQYIAQQNNEVSSRNFFSCKTTVIVFKTFFWISCQTAVGIKLDVEKLWSAMQLSKNAKSSLTHCVEGCNDFFGFLTVA